MSKIIISLLFFVITADLLFVHGCLITNCPRGGKRSGGKFDLVEGSVKPCVSCGPGHSGQCFGPNICCGPFGCLMGTPETLRCQRDGYFQDREPCIAGSAPCRKNTGRCAIDGVCCSQDACYSDKQCLLNFEEKPKIPENLMAMDLYNLMNYQEMTNE